MPNALAAAAMQTGTPSGPSGQASAALPGPAPGDSSGAPPGAGGVGLPGDEPPQGVTVAQLKDAIHHQAAIDHKLQGLLKGGKPVERKDAVNACIAMVSEGIFSAEQMASYLMTLPNEPMKIREWVQKHATKVEQNLNHMLVMAYGEEFQQGQQGAPGEQPPAAPAAGMTQ